MSQLGNTTCRRFWSAKSRYSVLACHVYHRVVFYICRKQEREVEQRKEQERKEKEAARAAAYTREYEEEKARSAAAGGKRQVCMKWRILFQSKLKLSSSELHELWEEKFDVSTVKLQQLLPVL